MPTAIFDIDVTSDPGDAIDLAIGRHQHLLNETTMAEIRAGHQFLWQYRGSKDTFATYRKELEKLHQFQLANQTNIPVGKFRVEHVEEFIEWCQYPGPEWVSDKVCTRRIRTGDKAGQPNLLWRPFSKRGGKDYNLSQSGLQSLFAIISSYYEYLIQEGHATSNPVKAVRQKSRFIRKITTTDIRRLTNEQVKVLRATSERMALQDPELHERTLFIICLLLDNYLRISEITDRDIHTPTMGDIKNLGETGWWLTVIGKGNKQRMIPLSEGSLQSLIRYRNYLGLETDLPVPGETTPLFAKKGARNRPLRAVRQVRNIIKDVFETTYQDMILDGRKREAAELSTATVHWLRHTGISEDVKVRPKEHVREDAGHGSLATTDLYIENELRERAASKRLTG